MTYRAHMVCEHEKLLNAQRENLLVLNDWIGEHWSTQANKRFRELVSSSNKLRMHFSDGIRGKLYIRLV